MVVLLVVNQSKDASFSVTKRLVSLMTDVGMEIVSYHRELTDSVEAVLYQEKETALSRADCIVTVGGDGTLLRVAPDAAAYEKPLLGVNLGTVGFMAEVGPDKSEWINRLAAEDYETEERMMIDVTVSQNGRVVFTDTALNDAVLSHGIFARMQTFSLFCNDRIVSEYRADGIIFATPTGSTAYSISAGGPVVDPSLNTILVTPLCAHTLASRPILFKDSSELSVKTKNLHDGFYLVVDGRAECAIHSDYEIAVKRSRKAVSLIRFDHHSFYSELSQKLK